MAKKWITDLAMTVLLLLLMAYSLVGEVLHEWMGITMLVLFLLHHIWNRAWYKSIGRGRPSPYRAVQTALNFLLFAVVLGMLLSGLILSQHILDFLPLQRGETIARTLHLPLSYWGFLLMSLHLGLHWSGIMNTVRRRLHIQSASRNRVLLLRLLAAVLVGYGLYAFAHYRFSDYLLLRTHFIFFAPDQTATRFVVDHLAVMGLFACAARYGGMSLRRFSGRKKENDDQQSTDCWRTCIGAGAFRLRRRPYRAVRPGGTRRSGHGDGVYRRYPHPDSHG